MNITGADPETVQRVCRLVDIAEFKRRQTRSVPGSPARHSDVIGGFHHQSVPRMSGSTHVVGNTVSPDSCSQPRWVRCSTAKREEVFGGEGTC